MENPQFFKKYKDHLVFNAQRYGKSTLFENSAMLVGLNCLEPGQEMEKHAHSDQHRFYIVLEGRGLMRVGEEKREVNPGVVAWIPAGKSHHIVNNGTESLVLLVGFNETYLG